MAEPVLHAVEVTGPAAARLARARRRTAVVQAMMLGSWGLLLPLLLVLPFGTWLPPRAGDAVAYLLVGSFMLGFLLWIPEAYFRRRKEAAQHAAFSDVEAALARLRAGWQVEWYAPYGGIGRERIVSRGSWKQRFEWRVEYRGGTMLLTEIPAAEHEEDDDGDQDG
ncbi:hypothetical protein ACFVRT_14545 [Arthrobacter koreensis]|uniref:hypothetical protein n=1 Tax=Arthrobacter koreensis TaxID=199136 RepID=UPI0036DABBD6